MTDFSPLLTSAEALLVRYAEAKSCATGIITTDLGDAMDSSIRALLAALKEQAEKVGELEREPWKIVCEAIIATQFQDNNRRGRLTCDVETLLHDINKRRDASRPQAVAQSDGFVGSDADIAALRAARVAAQGDARPAAWVVWERNEQGGWGPWALRADLPTWPYRNDEWKAEPLYLRPAEVPLECEVVGVVNGCNSYLCITIAGHEFTCYPRDAHSLRSIKAQVDAALASKGDTNGLE